METPATYKDSLTFLLQAALLILYVPMSYWAYRYVRAPARYKYDLESLKQLGLADSLENMPIVSGEYHLKHYFWPLLGSMMVIFVTFCFTHPYPIQHEWWVGIIEDVINVFKATETSPTIVVGRVLSYAFFGAYIYSFQLIFWRFMAYDLTPSVYIFTATRFISSFFTSAVVIVGLGTFLTSARPASLDTNIAVVYIVAWFVGFFPEQGLNWLTAVAQRALRNKVGISKERPLSEIEGLSIWHQGRLKQEGIENAQNLAMADIAGLVTSTPFTVRQIVDWIDQAILLSYANNEQYSSLNRGGVFRATDILFSINNDERIGQLVDATGLKKSEVKILYRGLKEAFNAEIIYTFRSKEQVTVLEASKVGKRTVLRPAPIGNIPTAAADTPKQIL
jgi:hypothetical protein